MVKGVSASRTSTVRDLALQPVVPMVEYVDISVQIRALSLTVSCCP